MARKGKCIDIVGYLGLLVGTGLTENGHSDYFWGGGSILKLDTGDVCTNLVSAYFHLGTQSDRYSVNTCFHDHHCNGKGTVPLPLKDFPRKWYHFLSHFIGKTKLHGHA